MLETPKPAVSSPDRVCCPESAEASGETDGIQKPKERFNTLRRKLQPWTLVRKTERASLRVAYDGSLSGFLNAMAKTSFLAKKQKTIPLHFARLELRLSPVQGIQQVVSTRSDKVESTSGRSATPMIEQSGFRLRCRLSGATMVSHRLRLVSNWRLYIIQFSR